MIGFGKVFVLLPFGPYVDLLRMSNCICDWKDIIENSHGHVISDYMLGSWSVIQGLR